MTLHDFASTDNLQKSCMLFKSSYMNTTCSQAPLHLTDTAEIANCNSWSKKICVFPDVYVQ